MMRPAGACASWKSGLTARLRFRLQLQRRRWCWRRRLRSVAAGLIAGGALSAPPVLGAFDAAPPGVRAAALSGAYGGLGSDPEALAWNPAGIGFALVPALRSTASRPFGLTDLEQHVFTCLWPWRGWSLGGGYSSMGRTDYYRESVLTVGLAHRWGREVAVALTVKALALDLRPTYGADWGCDMGAGLGWRPRPGLRFGLAGDNLRRSGIGRRTQVRPPRTWRVGIARQFDAGAWLAVDLVAKSDRPLDLRLGQEITLAGRLALRAGVRTAVTRGWPAVPTRYSLGGGVKLWRLRVDYAFVSHPQLGGTHHLGIGLDAGDPKESPAAGSGAPKVVMLSPARRVDLNRADVETLTTVPGIGPVLAARIVAYRNGHGPFTDIRELSRIPGITPEQVSRWSPCFEIAPR